MTEHSKTNWHSMSSIDVLSLLESDEYQGLSSAEVKIRLEKYGRNALPQRMTVLTPAIIISTLGWFIVRLNYGIPFAEVQTETFTLLVVCEWFNVLNCRSRLQSALSLSIFKNPWLLGGLILGNLLHVAIIYWPPMNRLFHTTPLNFKVVLAIGVVGSLVLWVDEARKYGQSF